MQLCIIFTIFCRVGVVHLVVLACVLRATTKKGRQLFLRKKKKILAIPVNLPTPGKILPVPMSVCYNTITMLNLLAFTSISTRMAATWPYLC